MMSREYKVCAVGMAVIGMLWLLSGWAMSEPKRVLPESARADMVAKQAAKQAAQVAKTAARVASEMHTTELDKAKNTADLVEIIRGLERRVRVLEGN